MRFLLTDRKIKSLKAGSGGKEKCYADGGGLYVVVRGERSQWSSFCFRGVLNGRRLPMMAIGPVSKWSLKEAREERNRYQEMLNAGKDPRQERRAKRNGGPRTVNLLLEEYFEKKIEPAREHDTESKRYARIVKSTAYLQRIRDTIGKVPVADVDVHMILETVGLQKQWTEQPPSAWELRRHLRRAFDIAVAAKWINENPASDQVLDALLSNHYHKRTPRAAIDYVDAPRFMAAVLGYKNRGLGRSEQPLDTVPPLLFLLLTGVRSQEVRCAKWREIDPKNRLWNVPWEHRKLGHTKEKVRAIPISKPMQAVIEEMKRRNPNAKDDDLIFPGGSRYGGVARGSMTAFIKHSLGWDVDITVHGFRATLKAWARAQRPAYPKFIYERQFDHSAREGGVAGYDDDDRPEMTDPTIEGDLGRREMMEKYGAYLVGSGPMPFDNVVNNAQLAQ